MPSIEGSDSRFVQTKLEEFFWEWLALPETEKLVRQTVQIAKTGSGRLDSSAENFPSPHFSALRTSPSTRPSPPGSPSRSFHRNGASLAGEDGKSPPSPSSPLNQPTSPPSSAVVASSKEVDGIPSKLEFDRPKADSVDSEPRLLGRGAVGNSKVIPRFHWPKRQQPQEKLSLEAKQKIHECFEKQGITDIVNSSQLEPIITGVFGLSKYFTLPVFYKIRVFHGIVDASAKSKSALLTSSPTPITEDMLLAYCDGKIQIDDPVLSFLYLVKMEHNNWIERDDFTVFLSAILQTHPGLDFLRETQEFQERYSDTVISRIFFVYDRKDVGRIYLSDLRRYKPSVIDTWKQLAEHDDIKMVRDYFSYEHFYVIYCTFWELDSDHDFLLDKDDLLKYDAHALSRRVVDRIFSEVPYKFTSAVPGKMGYEDFIRFLLCDQDRSTDRSVEFWFHLFDIDGDGCIRDHEMKYFYEEQVQRMECLNYETISFADIMCQMNDMIFPKAEGQFRLSDFKKRRKFAGTFFSLFSSLNKFLTFEHRDPFLAKQEQLDNPSFTDWDRWCADEYLRLAMEEGDECDEDNTQN